MHLGAGRATGVGSTGSSLHLAAGAGASTGGRVAVLSGAIAVGVVSSASITDAVSGAVALGLGAAGQASSSDCETALS